MAKAPPNSEIGQRNSRAVRSARSQDRSRAVWEDICFLAFRDRPTTNAEYADILNAEGRPTPSGRGKWIDKLVQRYMSKFKSNAKKLLAETPKRPDAKTGYAPEVYAALRAELLRLNAATDANGIWTSATNLAPLPLQSVFHETWGFGEFGDQVSPAHFRCRFIGVDAEGDTALVEHNCRAVDLKLFTFHRTAEERRLAAVDFWERLIRDHKQTVRYLVDGWHQ